MDLVFQGWAVLIRGQTPDILAKARGFYERALKVDPGNIDALIGVAAVDTLDAWSYQINDPRSLMAAAEAQLSKALAAAPNNQGLICHGPGALRDQSGRARHRGIRASVGA